jgi:thiamine biosynthesis protein ThiS
MAATEKISIMLNGEPRTVGAGLSVQGLISELGRDPRTVAVEYNGSILRRQELADTRLAAGDQIEVVHFVQGG